MNYVNDKIRDGLLAVFFKVTDKSPLSIWRSADESEIGDNREKRSISVPYNICVLMELATGGGSNASAFGGMGRGVLEERENGALGAEQREGKRGGMAGAGACTIREGKLELGERRKVVGKGREWWVPGLVLLAEELAMYVGARAVDNSLLLAEAFGP